MLNREMVKIQLHTIIKAPIERVFDLSRSIDLHKLSTKGTNEEAIAGKTEGLIELGETVTWRAKHLGVYQKLTVKIVDFKKPFMFEDRMLKGVFKSMNHVHQFEEQGSETIMKDVFMFEAPLGILGKVAEFMFLKNYMLRFLEKRNDELKWIAEGDGWVEILG
jgi:ligand-binding SRPBCC domain-containing protein